MRKELADEWDDGLCVKQGQEYAILTDEIIKAHAGFGKNDLDR